MEKVIHNHIDPVAMKEKEKHSESLADIARRLIRGLEDVTRTECTSNERLREAYVLPNDDSAIGHHEITKEQLSERINQNIELILAYKGRFYRSCFIPHVKNELPEEMRTGLLSEVTEENPFELIKCMMLLADKKPFVGICPRCKYWSQPMACPISHP